MEVTLGFNLLGPVADGVFEYGAGAGHPQSLWMGFAVLCCVGFAHFLAQLRGAAHSGKRTLAQSGGIRDSTCSLARTVVRQESYNSPADNTIQCYKAAEGEKSGGITR